MPRTTVGAACHVRCGLASPKRMLPRRQAPGQAVGGYAGFTEGSPSHKDVAARPAPTMPGCLSPVEAPGAMWYRERTVGGNDVLAFVLAACIAQTDWSGVPPRHDLTDEEKFEARDAIAQRVRASGVLELAQIANSIVVRRGEGAPYVFIEVVTQDEQGRANTRVATWTRLAWAGEVFRPESGWLEVADDRIEAEAARIPDEELRRHVLAVARQAREQTARP